MGRPSIPQRLYPEPERRLMNLLVEGFDWFPTGKSSAARLGYWNANGFYMTNNQDPGEANVASPGRFGFGKAIQWNYSQGSTSNFNSRMNGYAIPLGAIPQTGFIGAAVFRAGSMHTTAGVSLSFYDAVTNAFQCCVIFGANGVVSVYRGDLSNGGVLLAQSAAGSFQDDEWFHAEVKAEIDNTAGSVEVRINTVPVIQLTSADTQATSHAYFDSAWIGVLQPSGQTGTINGSLDDLFVNDTTGAQNNTWLGNVRVKTQFMIANGATNNFTIGGSAPAATNWQSVNNINLDDTEYVYDSTVGDIDLYTPDPNLNSPLVHSLQVRMGLRQDDATQRVGRAQLRIGTTVYPGVVDQYTNQTYTFYKERFELNPATAVAFTGADVNGLQAGVKVQA